jgi:hypothetical protein
MVIFVYFCWTPLIGQTRDSKQTAFRGVQSPQHLRCPTKLPGADSSDVEEIPQDISDSEEVCLFNPCYLLLRPRAMLILLSDVIAETQDR